MTRYVPPISIPSDFAVRRIFAYSLDEYPALFKALGQPKFRAKQLTEWLYANPVDSYEEMTNFSEDLRAKLALVAPLQRANIIECQTSTDGTRKYLIEFDDGEIVEAVGLPTKDRLTVCLSSQAGCTFGCTFCATGQAGFRRNLLPGEIAEQVRLVEQDFNRRVSNVVVMGQGEPFANYDAVLSGLRILNSEQGMNIGARHITVSTSGLVEGIDRFAQEPEQFTLAVSLHSAIQGTRDLLMPGLATQTLDKLFLALENYYLESGRRPSLEYALIDGPQTEDKEVSEIIRFAKRIGAHVNLIPINPITNGEAKPPSRTRITGIARAFEEAHVTATVRMERGGDIAAACGQLANTYRKA